MNDHELLSSHLVKVYKREIEQGRNPKFKIEWSSPGTGLTLVRLQSEQISEGLECRPVEFAAFKDLLKQNGISIEK